MFQEAEEDSCSRDLDGGIDISVNRSSPVEFGAKKIANRWMKTKKRREMRDRRALASVDISKIVIK